MSARHPSARPSSIAPSQPAPMLAPPPGQSSRRDSGAAAPAAAATGVRSVASHVVLVVDDAPADRDLLCLLLRAWGLRPVAAADGWEALVCARTLRPALVVTDLRMPRLDGRALLALLRAGAGTAHIPVLVVTGETGHAPGDREPVIGSSGVLRKPVDARALRRAVEALLAGARDPSDQRR
jgi:CheY-like chemotaxis protein